ncbi:MAG: hypothetical protein ABI206_09275 [Antricoccus sp.]
MIAIAQQCIETTPVEIKQHVAVIESLKNVNGFYECFIKGTKTELSVESIYTSSLFDRATVTILIVPSSESDLARIKADNQDLTLVLMVRDVAILAFRIRDSPGVDKLVFTMPDLQMAENVQRALSGK